MVGCCRGIRGKAKGRQGVYSQWVGRFGRGGGGATPEVSRFRALFPFPLSWVIFRLWLVLWVGLGGRTQQVGLVGFMDI